MIIEKSYYVAPDTKRGNDKAYSLLVKILSDTKKIAIGKIVLRDKENIVSLRPYQRGMVMHILRYLDEIKPTDDIAELRKQRSNDLNWSLKKYLWQRCSLISLAANN